MKNTKQSENLRIAIQGFSGAFHEIAVNHFHGHDCATIVPAHTFDELVGVVEKGEKSRWRYDGD